MVFASGRATGIHLRLNGITWQGFTEHGVPGDTPEAYLAALKNPQFNYGFGRMWPQHGGRYKWLGQEPEQVLTFMDRGGALIRRTGYLDGEAAGYMPAVLPELGKNWIDHLQAWIKGERNHPSIMIWSVENELNFINARNLGQLDVWEPVLADAWKAIQQVDPTRPIMVDGGGATRAQTLPVHGDHYTTKPFWNYPQLAYEANADQPPWTWDQQRPKFIGEELFAAGINPAYAYFGGEQVFLGKSGNRPAVGKAMQVISQGYRWFGVTACDFCQQPSDADGSQYNGWAPRAVLVRQWDYYVCVRSHGETHGRRVQQHAIHRSPVLPVVAGARWPASRHQHDRASACRPVKARNSTLSCRFLARTSDWRGSGSSRCRQAVRNCFATSKPCPCFPVAPIVGLHPTSPDSRSVTCTSSTHVATWPHSWRREEFPLRHSIAWPHPPHRARPG